MYLFKYKENNIKKRKLSIFIYLFIYQIINLFI